MPHPDQIDMCDGYNSTVLGDAIMVSSPYIFPFVVEFALIGAAIFFSMYRHVGKLCTARDSIGRVD